MIQLKTKLQFLLWESMWELEIHGCKKSLKMTKMPRMAILAVFAVFACFGRLIEISGGFQRIFHASHTFQ